MRSTVCNRPRAIPTAHHRPHCRGQTADRAAAVACATSRAAFTTSCAAATTAAPTALSRLTCHCCMPPLSPTPPLTALLHLQSHTSPAQHAATCAICTVATVATPSRCPWNIPPRYISPDPRPNDPRPACLRKLERLGTPPAALLGDRRVMGPQRSTEPHTPRAWPLRTWYGRPRPPEACTCF